MNEEQQALARKLFECGAVLINTKNGFSLRLHEDNPSARRSPIKFNIRPPGEKRGAVNKRLYRQLGLALAHAAVTKLGHCPDVFIGMPAAGDHLVDALLPQMDMFKGSRKWGRVRLEKTVESGVRRFTGKYLIEGKFSLKRRRGLLVDDLVTSAKTLIEGLHIGRTFGLNITDCLVVIDREQGGVEKLKKLNVRTHSLLRMTPSLNFYRDENFITARQHDAIMKYLKG